MNSQLQDVSIPKYSLREASATGSRLFEVLEAKGEQARQHPSIFLEPHRKDYYLLAFVKHGSSRHWVDMTPYTLKPDTFYFSVPHQVHVKEQAKPLTGILLCFTDEFLAIEENQFLKQLPLVQNLHNGHELELSGEDVKFIEDILEKIITEYKQKQDWRNTMLLAYLRVLLIYASRLYTVQFVNDDRHEERALLNKFRHLIEEQYLQLHDVAAYANLLFISAGHLSEVVKQQSGKTAIEHIHERLMLEAKRLLFHNDNSIKEIAFQLGLKMHRTSIVFLSG